MDLVLNVSVNHPERLSQKCYLPLNLLKDASFKIGDYITIRCRSKTFICKVYPSRLASINCFNVEDTVSFPYSNEIFDIQNLKCVYPRDILLQKIKTFKEITVKLILALEKNIYIGFETYKNIIRDILSVFVIKKGAVINCAGHKLAIQFHIHCIVVHNTSGESTACGQLAEDGTVVFYDITCLDQLSVSNFVEIGGLDDQLNQLYILRNTCKNILVSGPSGCGKTSLIRKFCSDTNSVVILIDGMKTQLLKLEICNIYFEKFCYFLKNSSRTCVLFIDHIDSLVPVVSKRKGILPMLVYLMKKLECLHVFIIATTVRKNLVHSSVSKLFEKEILLQLPNSEQRKNILQTLTKPYLNCDIDLHEVALKTPGFVGRDLAFLCEKAKNLSLQQKSHGPDSKKKLTTQEFYEALLDVEPSILKGSHWRLKVKPIRWKEIGGMLDIKKRIHLTIEQPLLNSFFYRQMALPCPRGLLLFGPPGCCKTTIARALATECNANFFAANSAQIYSLYVGESEKNIADLFYEARLAAPSIIFFDELDSLFCQRKQNNKNQDIATTVLATLLSEMDGFGVKTELLKSSTEKKLLENVHSSTQNSKEEVEQSSNDGIIVIGATNRPDLIDDALLRPGRFDTILYVSSPDVVERESILKTIAEGVPLKDVDFKALAEATEMLSGADLKHLYNTAAAEGLRADSSMKFITGENYDAALKKIMPSITKEQIQFYEKHAERYGLVTRY